jgi:hypothetical protein
MAVARSPSRVRRRRSPSSFAVVVRRRRSPSAFAVVDFFIFSPVRRRFAHGASFRRRRRVTLKKRR